jgi:hypothetical protein
LFGGVGKHAADEVCPLGVKPAPDFVRRFQQHELIFILERFRGLDHVLQLQVSKQSLDH